MLIEGFARVAKQRGLEDAEKAKEAIEAAGGKADVK